MSTTTTTTATTSSTGAGPHAVGVVKGDGTEGEITVSDCNSRCRTAFNEEEPELYYTTAGHGLPYRRTLRARKVPSPGSGYSGGGGGSCRVSTTTRGRRSTVALRVGQPGKKEVHHDRKDSRWVWPQGELSSSRPDIGHPLSCDHSRRPTHGLARREEMKEGRCRKKSGVVGGWDQGKSKDKMPPPSSSSPPSRPSPLDSVVWDHELVVHHPRVPAGHELRAELTPAYGDAAVGARRLESLFSRETAAEDGDDDPTNDRPVVVLGSLRGICSSGGGRSVVKFYLTAASGGTAVGGSDSGGGGGGGRRGRASWLPSSSLDGENCAAKILPLPLRGKGG